MLWLLLPKRSTIRSINYPQSCPKKTKKEVNIAVRRDTDNELHTIRLRCDKWKVADSTKGEQKWSKRGRIERKRRVKYLRDKYWTIGWSREIGEFIECIGMFCTWSYIKIIGKGSRLRIGWWKWVNKLISEVNLTFWRKPWGRRSKEQFCFKVSKSWWKWKRRK